MRGGGGIQPDVLVEPAELSRLEMVLDASGSITSFATEYLQSHEISADFAVTPDILDQLRTFLTARRIQPAVSDFLKDRA